MNIIFRIDGGRGKSIMATAVCKAIKRQYPDDQLIVITGYPEVFLCNPNVDRVCGFHDLSYFYRDHIMGKEVKTFLFNPYDASDFINLNGHLIEVWCKIYGIKYNGEQPELFINERERTFYGNQLGTDKPIFIIQTNGGGADQPNKYSWTRDIPIGLAQMIVNEFAKEYSVVHICRKDQLQLQNVIPLEADFRFLAVAILLSSKRLFIDSFAQHAAAALGKPSVVCWIGNIPSQFGYEMHTNIVANKPTLKPEMRNAVFSRYNIAGQPTEFPYNSDRDIFNGREIIAALRNESFAGKPKKVKNIHIKERIQQEFNKRSEVARRLRCLNETVDLSEIKQVMEIGSWHLEQSVELSNIFREAKIDAFEPVPESYARCLNRHGMLDEEKRKRISVHNLALNDNGGIIPFYQVDTDIPQKIDAGFSSVFKFNDGLKNSYYGDSLVQKEISVQAETLDNWCRKNNVESVDLIWIDVQGAELLVFKGAEDILKNTKIIMTEVGLKPYYEGHSLKPDIDKFLSDRGFYELESAFELNGFDFEANTIYLKNGN